AESQILRASTRAVESRVWKGLRIEGDRRLPTQRALYPCIESVEGRLYCSECRAGKIWLSELDDNLELKSTNEWIGPHMVDGKPCYQGQTQMTVVGHKIYISWKRTFHGDAPNARQCVASYDTRSGKIGKTFVIEPDKAGESIYNGGIATVNGKLWVSYCRWRPTDKKGYRTTVTVRELDYEGRKLGPAFELDSQPTQTPYGPFLSVFKDEKSGKEELIVCFTDYQAKVDMQPLWLVRFDGKRFHGLMTISPNGYNQYAKGVQVGNRLLLIWKYGAPYPARIFGRYMFHEIGMALVDPVGNTVEITPLTDDLKYNSSPDITWHNGRLVFVYNKLEHLYGSREDPAEMYGGFIGILTPVGGDKSKAK
ncbi:MAG: hypothetical protein JXM70_05955, partial [Pirellulales bacterium]|nr:hypothetical protein [Pirellulales bacterium]